ncbi:hypothetical protein [Psychrobacter sp. PAMC 21119]|uniref:hypothetical protein n=1 Tax=Psychrobacter sp. PAMC 21119 TaxID=1112209 RepID=UPI00028881EA|nr:hypothetical protein [Psychrobacter sp. PAMC 21119]
MLYIKKLSFGLAVLGACVQAQAIDLVTNGDTTLSIGGYVKAEGIFYSPDEGESEFKGSGRQSRINVKTTKNVEDKKLTGFIEGDFYGNAANGGSDLRLRHAYVQVDDLTVGKTWNGQFLAVYPLLTDQLDFRGTGLGTISGGGADIRPDLTVHYTHKEFRFTAQDPVYDEANLPDMVVSYKNNISDLSYNVAVTARETKNGDDSDVGVGVSLAGKLKLGNDSLHASVYNGKGMGVYSTVCVGRALGTTGDLDCDAEDGKLVSQTGYTVGYRHKFTEKLMSNIRYGKIMVDDEADTSVNVKSINLVYEYLPDLDIGIEWRDRSDKTLSQVKKGQQVEIMAKYNF